MKAFIMFLWSKTIFIEKFIIHDYFANMKKQGTKNNEHQTSILSSFYS